MLLQRAGLLGLTLKLQDFDANRFHAGFSVLHTPGGQASAGQLDPACAGYVLDCLRKAAQGCMENRFQAMVTGPVHKENINKGGVAFTGHTEFLAALTSTPTVVMLLVAGDLRVALQTTHLPLRQVADAITQESLEARLRILHSGLKQMLSSANPRIAVAGLNPHAGEGGVLGREEIDIITPAVHRLAKEGLNISGPESADTLFTPNRLTDYDAVLSMYHDQGLPVLKYAGFGQAVNVTLGLPLIRTSVDHGTALELAGTGQADAGSLQAALALAADMAFRRTAGPC